MKRIVTTTVIALFLLGTASVASAQHGHGRSHGRSQGSAFGIRVGNVGISFGSSPRYSSRYAPSQRSYGYSRGYGGYSQASHGGYYQQTRRPVWHDTTHLDYHRPSAVRHGNHYDIIPSHYDVHRSGHWDH